MVFSILLVYNLNKHFLKCEQRQKQVSTTSSPLSTMTASSLNTVGETGSTYINNSRTTDQRDIMVF